MKRYDLDVLQFASANLCTKFALTDDYVCWTDEDKVTCMNIATTQLLVIDLNK